MGLNLILIGLAVALDPLPMAAFLVLLPSRRGVLKGAGFLFGWLVSMAVVVALTIVTTGNQPPKPHTAPSTAALAGKLAIGVVLVVIGVRRRRRRNDPPRPKKEPKWQAGVDNMSPWYAIGLAPVLQPWGLIAAGVLTVLEAKVSSPESALALFGFCVLATGSYMSLEIYAGFRPDQSAALMARVRAWIDGHTDQVVIIGSLVLGFWLVANSIYLIVS